jgi:hypothetical protein
VLKYIISITIITLFVTIGVNQVQTQLNQQLETDYKNKMQLTNIIEQTQPINTILAFDIQQEPEPINPDILKVQEITNWDIEIATYFVEEANVRNVDIFQEALPIAHIETGGTYRFNASNTNTNGSTDGGLFQLNSITYKEIVKQLKAQGREFDSWDRNDPYVNIAGGIYWIAYLKDKHNLEDEALFTSYNRGVHGAKQYASRSGTYETRYSREVIRIRTELIK